MSLASLFLLRTLVLLWIFCAVVCKHQKRDVHRIIIKQRIPVGPKKSHQSHGHGHKHSHGHYHAEKGHGHKEGREHRGSYEKDASFDDEGSFSREHSFEDFLKSRKVHKSRHQTKKPHRRPSHTTASQDLEESKQELRYRDNPRTTFHSDWTPLSAELHEPSEETHIDRYRWRKDGKSKKHYLKSMRPPPVDLTTSYPFQFETTSVFPQLTGYPSAFTNYKIINQSPLIGTIEQPNLFTEARGDSGRLKNHRTSYDVTELSPADSNISTFITVPDDSVNSSNEPKAEESVKHSYVEVKSTKKPRNPRGRGGVTFKQTTKV